MDQNHNQIDQKTEAESVLKDKQRDGDDFPACRVIILLGLHANPAQLVELEQFPHHPHLQSGPDCGLGRQRKSKNFTQ